MKVEVTGGDKYKKVLEKIAAVKVAARAGIPAGATTTGGKSIPEYAVYNEMGTSRIPARPFMRTTVSEHQDEWSEVVANSLNYNEIKKDGAVRAMGLAGELMKAHIQQTIQRDPLVIYRYNLHRILFASFTGMVTTATVPFSELVMERLPFTMLCSRSLTLRMPT
jgi:hypothetical protein